MHTNIDWAKVKTWQKREICEEKKAKEGRERENFHMLYFSTLRLKSDEGTSMKW